jgi:hypothetical protein
MSSADLPAVNLERARTTDGTRRDLTLVSLVPEPFGCSDDRLPRAAVGRDPPTDLMYPPSYDGSGRFTVADLHSTEMVRYAQTPLESFGPNPHRLDHGPRRARPHLSR